MLSLPTGKTSSPAEELIVLLVLTCRRPGRTSAGRYHSCRRCTTRASCCSRARWSCSLLTGQLRCSALRTARWEAPPHPGVRLSIEQGLGTPCLPGPPPTWLWGVARQALLLGCRTRCSPWRITTCIVVLLAVVKHPGKHGSPYMDTVLSTLRKADAKPAVTAPPSCPF